MKECASFVTPGLTTLHIYWVSGGLPWYSKPSLCFTIIGLHKVYVCRIIFFTPMTLVDMKRCWYWVTGTVVGDMDLLFSHTWMEKQGSCHLFVAVHQPDWQLAHRTCIAKFHFVAHYLCNRPTGTKMWYSGVSFSTSGNTCVFLVKSVVAGVGNYYCLLVHPVRKTTCRTLKHDS